jgi:hypothetical protein
LTGPQGGASRAPASAARWATWAGLAFTAASLAWAALVFYGMGPEFGDAAWYEPTGWLAVAIRDTDLYPLADELRYALALFGGLALLLAAAVLLTTRSAVARLLSAFSVIAVGCFLYYSIEAPFVWRFFGWRWSASMGLFSLAVAAVLTAPPLAASWLRLPVWARALTYLPVAFGVLAYERNVTGTDQSLRFALSPWPVVQIFGIELIGTCLGALVLGVGAALWIAGTGSGTPWARRAAGGVLAGALPALALFVGSEQNLRPGGAGSRALLMLAATGALTFAAAASGLGGDRARRAARVRHWTLGGLLVLAPVLIGQLWARRDYEVTRDDRAERVIDALAARYSEEGIYPDSLQELVDAGALDEVPSPRIGFALLGRQEFVYQSFGTSFLLEFSAPRWIQCAYNPPYPDEYDDEEEDEEADDGLGAGSWSCPSKPPELW